MHATIGARSLPTAIALVVSSFGSAVRAQTPPAPRATAHPDHIASSEAIADARTFSIQRAGDRVLVTYVQANDPHARGALRTVELHADVEHAGLSRVGADTTLAPAAYAIASSWDGTRGAVAYTVPRPHRGEAPGTHRQRPGSTERALADPLGSSALTAADVMLQRIDAHGHAVGRPTLVFEENSRAYRVAVAPDGEGWTLAWTGAMSIDGEVRGTVRIARVDAQGDAPSFASETNFTGQVGDALAIAPRTDDRADPLVLFAGESCTTREHDASPTAPTTDPSEAAGIRPGEQRFQHPPNEHPGPPIVCDVWRLVGASLHSNGTTTLHAGPPVSSDALAIAHTSRGGAAVIVPVRDDRGASLVRFDIANNGELRRSDELLSARDAPDVAYTAAENDAESTSALTISPARIAPPRPPDATGIAIRPRQLGSDGVGDALAIAALSVSRARVAYATHAPRGDGALELLAPAPHVSDLALATDCGNDPWLFALVEIEGAGPIVFDDLLAPSVHPAEPESVWAGDERFRLYILHARAARAAFNAEENVFGPLAERPDVATNPRMPGIVAELHRLWNRWQSACEPLTERARWLARHGVDPSVNDLARAQCELPPEPTVPTAPIPPGP